MRIPLQSDRRRAGAISRTLTANARRRSAERVKRNVASAGRYVIEFDRTRRVPCPLELSTLRLGQRMFFVGEQGRVIAQTRPRVSSDGRFHSSRIKRMTITLARFGPRARYAAKQSTGQRHAERQ